MRFLLLMLPIIHTAFSSNVRQIWHDILDKYDKRLRPVKDQSQPINVSVNIYVENVIDLIAVRQTLLTKIWFTMRWKDEFLQFNASYYGIENLEANVEDLWLPDLYLYGSLDENTGGFLPKISTPILSSTGEVFYIPPVFLKSYCQFQVLNYPFDTQNCSLTFSSWAYNRKKMRLIWDDTYSSERSLFSSGEWKIMPIQCNVELLKFTSLHEEPVYDMIKCTLAIKRRPLFYIVNLVVPCMLLLIIGSFTFLLPVDSGEKVSLSVTILLAMTVFVLVLMENIPPSSDGVPFLGKFILACTALLALSTVMAVIIVNLSNRGSQPTSSNPSSFLNNKFFKSLAGIGTGQDFCHYIKANNTVERETELNGELWKIAAGVFDKLFLIIYLVFLFIIGSWVVVMGLL